MQEYKLMEKGVTVWGLLRLYKWIHLDNKIGTSPVLINWLAPKLNMKADTNMSTVQNNTTAQTAQYVAAREAANVLLEKIARSNKSVLVIGGYKANLQVRSRDGIKSLVYTCRGVETVYKPGNHGLSKIVWLNCMVRPSLPAVSWIKEQKIELSIISANGEDMTENYIGKVNRFLQTQQTDLARDEQKQLEYAANIMLQKTQAQAATLRKYAHVLNDGTTEQAEMIDSLARWFTQTGNRITQTKQDMMVEERNIANRYFECWHGLEIKWSDKQVAREYRSYQHRTDHTRNDRNHTPENRKAHHPVNAMLNFSYAQIERRIKRECLKNGIDTTCSFYHADCLKDEISTRESLLYDLVEPLRAVIDAAILKFLEKHSLLLNWFIIDSETGEVKLSWMFCEVMSMWLEKEILDSMVEEVVCGYVQFLRSNEFTITKSVRASGKKTTAKRTKKVA